MTRARAWLAAITACGVIAWAAFGWWGVALLACSFVINLVVAYHMRNRA